METMISRSESVIELRNFVSLLKMLIVTGDQLQPLASLEQAIGDRIQLENLSEINAEKKAELEAAAEALTRAKLEANALRAQVEEAREELVSAQRIIPLGAKAQTELEEVEDALAARSRVLARIETKLGRVQELMAGLPLNLK